MPSPTADLPSPHAVAFDLDGTLVDTVETRIQASSDEDQGRSGVGASIGSTGAMVFTGGGS
ncbi:MAG TPA: hypothetical protein VEW45_01110, partial [Candidatus Dormibacteraeota bacterium]|nr:hypothetical protein [Candidatus Dormibacteraeota bacterium]